MRRDDNTLNAKLRWLLLGLTAGTYCQVAVHGFVNYDDAFFVFQNPHVYTGLSLANLKWAFTTLNGGTTSYQPFVWLTHQLDCQLFGLQAGAHHLTNLWVHIANTVLLFTVLETLTSKPWRSGMVAALFALHPLHVETVAWIAERKSLVCTLFWLLTTLAYVRYVRRGSVGKYLIVLLFYAAALLSKPIAVSLPITLLLLDYWPLNRLRSVHNEPGGSDGACSLSVRFGRRDLTRLVVEKLPLFVLCTVVCWVTIIAQTDLGATKSLEEVPMSVRWTNSVVACVLYLRKMVWPSDIAPIYLLRHDWASWQVATSGLLLLAISLLAVSQTKQRPYFMVGWVWYLVTLLPTLGLVQVGLQGMADRYSYVPLIGIFLFGVWGLAELIGRMRYAKPILWVGVGGLVGACALSTLVTVQYWQDSVRLFEHAVRVTSGNYVAHHQLGMAYEGNGNLREAERHYREASRIAPDKPVTHLSLGDVLFREGNSQGAFEQYSLALKLKTTNPQTHRKLAQFFMRSPDPQLRDPRKALEHARLA